LSDILLIARAWNFSAERHAKQKRKGDAQEPYVNHLAEVAELVATATEGRDANLVAAAVLHDTVEDTATLPGELASIFNADVADLVSEVTDDKRIDKAERKRFLSWLIRHRICVRWPRVLQQIGAWNANASIWPGPGRWCRACAARMLG
jgi:(p)ppGpp synthase/HD superfamily hydrolase